MRTGILLINLGSPDATDPKSMRRYLKKFLGDKRVVEAKGLLWWLVFNGIILRKRPKSSGKAYASIWNNELNESPLKTITRAQAEKVEKAMGEGYIVDWAMRYGSPDIGSAIKRMAAQGVENILFFPLYPQYSAATTATAMDTVFDTLKTMRFQPNICTVPPYYTHPAYIEALAKSVKTHHATLGWQPEVTLASLHGLPVSFIEKGDPYQAHCEATVAALRAALNADKTTLPLTYQSRTGRQEWIGPDTEETLVNLAKNGVKNVSILAPGFAADCIETLEELHIRAITAFKAAGGNNATVVPCLNDSKASVSMLTMLIKAAL
ncbi:MAG TPA: ferrochelatase [Rhodobacteraceae bacterium]|nr:ferrochelatase [Paracoccaceae bacterium]